MWQYWVLYLCPIVCLYSPFKVEKNFKTILWITYISILIFVIGLRHRIGGDWHHYLNYFEYTKDSSFLNIFRISDPLYIIINWIGAQLSLNIYFVNTICGIIFILSLFYFCSKLPNTLLAIIISFPFMILVVGMGYTRQSLSVAFILLILSLKNNKFFLKYFLSVLAILSHRTSLLIIFCFLFPYNLYKKNILIALIASFIFSLFAIFVFYMFFSSDISHMYGSYVQMSLSGQQYSFGVYYRVALNLFPIIFFILNYSRFAKLYPDSNIYLIFSIIMICISPFSFYFSTLVDRLTIFLTFLQIALWPRLINLSENRKSRILLQTSIIVLYTLVMFVWLNFANNRYNWVPYFRD